jgi:hypothetical protein
MNELDVDESDDENIGSESEEKTKPLLYTHPIRISI